MKVVLVKNVSKIGTIGDVIEVKEGYAKNFLFPKGLAVNEKDSFGQKVILQREKAIKEKTKIQDAIKNMITEIEGSKIEFKVKTNAKGQLFASIGQDDIKKAVAGTYKVKPLNVEGVPLKMVGEHIVTVGFGGGNKASLRVNILTG